MDEQPTTNPAQSEPATDQPVQPAPQPTPAPVQPVPRPQPPVTPAASTGVVDPMIRRPAAAAPVQSPAPTPIPTAPNPLQSAPHPTPPASAPMTAATPTSTGPVKNDKDSFAKNFGSIAWAALGGFVNWIVIPVAIVFILHNFVFQAYHVVGSSMVPTLHESDYLIVSKVDNSLSKFRHQAYVPGRGQVVIFHYPKDPSLTFVKRVIGLPGERVVVKDGTITVYNKDYPNGFTPDNDTYQRAASTTEGDIDEVIPDDNIFVVGDNRTPGGSFDSREWGTLPSSYIIGNVVLRLLPLDGFRVF